jgi:hypothetical protein
MQLSQWFTVHPVLHDAPRHEMAWGNNGRAPATMHEKDVVSLIVQQPYSRERANGIYWIESWLGPTAGVHTLGRRRKPLFLPGIEQFFLVRGQVSVLTVVITCCATAQRLVAGLSSRRPQFNPRPVHVRFVVNKVALGYISVLILFSSPVSITAPTAHSHSFVHLSLTLGLYHLIRWRCR